MSLLSVRKDSSLLYSLLFCLIQARNADTRGHIEAADTHSSIALGLNICGLLSGILVVVGVVITIDVILSANENTVCYGYNEDNGYTYSYYCQK